MAARDGDQLAVSLSGRRYSLNWTLVTTQWPTNSAKSEWIPHSYRPVGASRHSE